MLPRVMIATALIVSLVLTASARSEETNCTQEEAVQAETEASKLHDWDDVYRSFGRFQHCDDGAISEGYSDSIGRLLAHHWITLPRLNALASYDESFKRFVIRHIDETIPNDELKVIVVNASTLCPVKCERLCKLIEDAANELKGP